MSYQSEVLADNPALFLPLNETSGASCADLSTNNFVGTASGTFTRNVSLGTGFSGVGPGTTLNGTITDHITVPSAAALNITGDVTYEAWIVPRSLTGTLFTIMTKGYQTDNTNQGYWLLVQNNTATNAIQFAQAFSGQAISLTGNNVVALNTVAHVVSTRVAATNVGTTYINGVQADQRTVAITSLASNTVAFTIGNGNGAGSFTNPFKATFAAVAIYPTALSAARVAAHYAARDIPPSGPVFATAYAFAV